MTDFEVKMIDSWDSTTKMIASVFSDMEGSRDEGTSENKTDTSTNSDKGSSCLRDSTANWLDKWWASSHSNVKGRILLSRRRSRSPRVKLSVSDISLEDYVASERFPKDIYYVSLNAPQGVGMNLFVSYEGLVLVQGLYKLRNGQSSPAQNCGVINVGDQLVQLNDINIEALSFYETTDLLKDLDLFAKVCFVCTFSLISVLIFIHMSLYPPFLPLRPGPSDPPGLPLHGRSARTA